MSERKDERFPLTNLETANLEVASLKTASLKTANLEVERDPIVRTEKAVKMPEVSLICPAFNEEEGLHNSIRKLRDVLDTLNLPSEVLLINDGSTDRTVQVAQGLIKGDPRFRIISHRRNFGRGRALKTGFAEARGTLVLTTEGDLSWGPETIRAMVETLRKDPTIDAVFASPHMEGGGYKNVPRHRVFLSKFGNIFLRVVYGRNFSMTTGMTRAYRSQVIKNHVFIEDDKEIHLEIAQRMMLLNYRVATIPAVLSWPDPKTGGKNRGRRTNWKKLHRIVRSHLAFAILQGIGHLILPAILALSALIIFFGGWATYNFLAHSTSIFLVQITGILAVLWALTVLGFFLFHHLFYLKEAVWRTQSMILQRSPEPAPLNYYIEETPR